jgi:hypothetical protein
LGRRWIYALARRPVLLSAATGLAVVKTLRLANRPHSVQRCADAPARPLTTSSSKSSRHARPDHTLAHEPKGSRRAHLVCNAFESGNSCGALDVREVSKPDSCSAQKRGTPLLSACEADVACL